MEVAADLLETFLDSKAWITSGANPLSRWGATTLSSPERHITVASSGMKKGPIPPHWQVTTLTMADMECTLMMGDKQHTLKMDDIPDTLMMDDQTHMMTTEDMHGMPTMGAINT